MLKGIYQSAYGLNVLGMKQEISATNLANINTSGYKKDGLFIREMQNLENKKNGTPRWEQRSMADATHADYRQGSYHQTENPMDLALDGEGFFVVQTFAGERYTRNGNFKLNHDGILVNSQNQPVLGLNGPIAIQGETVAIGENGQVFVDDQMVDQIRVVDFEKPYELVKTGEGLLAKREPMALETESEARVKQGFLEDSNVNMIEEMVDMLETFRHFESGQKLITAQDETLNTLINQVGRLE